MPHRFSLFRAALSATALCLALATTALAAEPPLPPGLGGGEKKTTEPALPAGLGGGEKKSDEPAVPPGLGGEAETKSTAPTQTNEPRWRWPRGLTGFAETRVGARTQEDPHQKETSIGEARLQLQYDKGWNRAALRLRGDFLYDPVLDDHAIDLETGDGWFDLREASLLLRPTDFMDVKAGRQVLTWGTGDQLFINDLFPKDWNSFFIGRDDEYLKAPSDAVKVALFSDWANLDIVYTPRFDSDRYIDGRRISYWAGSLDRIAGRDAVVRVDKPDDWFRDDEWAARLYRNVGTFELAGYAYTGFWKSPGGQDHVTGRALFPELQVYGASLRGPVGKGILNLEMGYYHSADDGDGDDPFTNNSEMRYLIGYEMELAKNLTGGFQYYVEQRLDHDAYMRHHPPGMPEKDQFRQVVTVRLTKLLMNQNLTLGLFAYWSPSDRDVYLRPKINYKIDDHWTAEVGANVFTGEEEHTFFGQFETNNNIYVSLRYGF